MTERIIASTSNQPVEIAFVFEFLISNKLYTATLIITIIPGVVMTFLFAGIAGQLLNYLPGKNGD